jgi:hypothetical protein
VSPRLILRIYCDPVVIGFDIDDDVVENESVTVNVNCPPASSVVALPTVHLMDVTVPAALHAVGPPDTGVSHASNVPSM